MRFASALATLVAAGALALVVAYWGWQIFAPPVVHIAAPGPADPAAAIIAEKLFGGGAAASAANPAPQEEVLGGEARLLGIIAEPQQRGYALFRLPGGPRLVAQGGEITPGATLVSVQPDAITVRDGAGERRFVLRTGAPNSGGSAVQSTSSAPRAGASTAQAPLAVASCAPPAGFEGSIVRLNTELLGGLAGDAAPWRALLVPTTDGLVVRDDGGFGAMLGLKSGDRLAQANGIALSAPEDIGSAVIRPLVQNQGVRIVGARDGARRELWLANVACAG